MSIIYAHERDYYTQTNVSQSFIRHLTLAASILALTSCTDDTGDYARGTGAIEVKVTIDNSVTSDHAGIETPASPALAEFSVRLSDVGGAYSHTWKSFDDFPQNDNYQVGAYQVEAYVGSIYQEGFDCPYFYGETRLTVIEGKVTSADVTATLANTMVSIEYSDAFRARFTACSATLHSEGGNYIDYPSEETRPVYLRPGNIDLGLTLTDMKGRTVSFQPATIPQAKARNHYRITLDIDGDNITVSYDPKLSTDDVTIPLSDHLFDGQSPTVSLSGFTSQEALHLTEGENVKSPLVMTLNSPAGMKQVTLTVQSPQLLAEECPDEINLLDMSAETRSFLTAHGLEWSFTGQGGNIDFTRLVNSLKYDTDRNSSSRFMVVVKDMLTRVNTPAMLNVVVEPVDLSVTSVSPAMIGVNRATITVSCPSADIERNIRVEALGADGVTWSPMTIESITPTDGSLYRINVQVPQGTAPLKARVIYCGNIKATFDIERVSPSYSLQVDAFASQAVIKVTADDASLTPTITETVNLFINNKSAAVLSRDTDNGLLTVIGLNPATGYSLTSTLLVDPTERDYTTAIGFTTEGTPQIPNPDFERIKETIKMKGIPSGGRYSQNIVEIFNGQNMTDFLISTPTDGWANTNAKTCSTATRNRNTWYMQPSVMIVPDQADNGYGVKLTSVAYDLNGPAIPDYLQEGQPFSNYSRNIPQIAHRAAGRLFLGSYSFDPSSMTERYNEGVGFGSRPSALNGFYKYQPCTTAPSDRGLVTVEVIGVKDGKETVIASGRALLPIATDYTAFAIPLSYKQFNVKATRLKVMIASSAAIGTIDEESRNIVTYSDPVTSSSTGSQLWIDNLSLSY